MMKIYVQILIKVSKWQNNDNVRINSYKSEKMTKLWKCTYKLILNWQNDKMMKMYVQTVTKVSKWENDENIRTDSYTHHITHIHTSDLYLTQVAVRVLAQMAVLVDGTCQWLGGVNTCVRVCWCHICHQQ